MQDQKISQYVSPFLPATHIDMPVLENASVYAQYMPHEMLVFHANIIASYLPDFSLTNNNQQVKC